LGAIFTILFREYLSSGRWLLFFGLLFVGFIVFSPTGLSACGGARRHRAAYRWRRRWRDASIRRRRCRRSCAAEPATAPSSPLSLAKPLAASTQ
jgi:hypothetical protein